jgi:hypothetical protein
MIKDIIMSIVGFNGRSIPRTISLYTQQKNNNDPWVIAQDGLDEFRTSERMQLIAGEQTLIKAGRGLTYESINDSSHKSNGTNHRFQKYKLRLSLYQI